MSLLKKPAFYTAIGMVIFGISYFFPTLPKLIGVIGVSLFVIGSLLYIIGGFTHG